VEVTNLGNTFLKIWFVNKNRCLFPVATFTYALQESGWDSIKIFKVNFFNTSNSKHKFYCSVIFNYRSLSDTKRESGSHKRKLSESASFL